MATNQHDMTSTKPQNPTSHQIRRAAHVNRLLPIRFSLTDRISIVYKHYDDSYSFTDGIARQPHADTSPRVPHSSLDKRLRWTTGHPRTLRQHDSKVWTKQEASPVKFALRSETRIIPFPSTQKPIQFFKLLPG